MRAGGPPRGKKEKEKKAKTIFQLQYEEYGAIHYWVTSFPGNLIAAGFAITALNDFSCVVAELHSYQQTNNLKCFTLIVPINKHAEFISWLKKSLKLKFEIKK